MYFFGGNELTVLTKNGKIPVEGIVPNPIFSVYYTLQTISLKNPHLLPQHSIINDPNSFQKRAHINQSLLHNIFVWFKCNSFKRICSVFSKVDLVVRLMNGPTVSFTASNWHLYTHTKFLDDWIQSYCVMRGTKLFVLTYHITYEEVRGKM